MTSNTFLIERLFSSSWLAMRDFIACYLVSIKVKNTWIVIHVYMDEKIHLKNQAEFFA